MRWAKLVRHFRVLYGSAPGKGKNKVLTQLKQRLQENQVPSSLSERSERQPKRKASETDLDEVSEVSSGGGINWALLAAKLKGPSKTEPVVEPPKRPVATPARAAQPLPGFVLENLKGQTKAKQVKPFATTGDDGAEAEIALDEPAVEAPSKKGKQTKQEKEKSRKEELRVEAALAGPSTAMVPAEPAATAKAYSPKDFNKMRVDFIAKARKEDGLTYKDANAKWMLSSLRAEYLATLPEKELKRRRFL